MVCDVVELKGLLDLIYELRGQGKSSSVIRGEVYSRYGLTLTDSQFQSLIRTVGNGRLRKTTGVG